MSVHVLQLQEIEVSSSSVSLKEIKTSAFLTYKQNAGININKYSIIDEQVSELIYEAKI